MFPFRGPVRAASPLRAEIQRGPRGGVAAAGSVLLGCCGMPAAGLQPRAGHGKPRAPGSGPGSLFCTDQQDRRQRDRQGASGRSGWRNPTAPARASPRHRGRGHGHCFLFSAGASFGILSMANMSLAQKTPNPPGLAKPLFGLNSERKEPSGGGDSSC